MGYAINQNVGQGSNLNSCHDGGNMVRKCFLAIMPLLIVAMAGESRAAVEKPKLVYSAGFGICTPLGGLSEQYSSGIAIGGTIGVAIPRSILEFRLDVGMDQVKVPGVMFGTPRQSGDLKTYGGSFQAMIKAVLSGPVVPYAMAGLGPYRSNSSGSDSYTGDYSGSTTSIGFTMGFGIKVLWEKFGLFVEYRYLSLRESSTLSRVWFGFVNR